MKSLLKIIHNCLGIIILNIWIAVFYIAATKISFFRGDIYFLAFIVILVISWNFALYQMFHDIFEEEAKDIEQENNEERNEKKNE